jgi:hypothetical protein
MERKPRTKSEKRKLIRRIQDRIRWIATALFVTMVVTVSLYAIAVNDPKLRPFLSSH